MAKSLLALAFATAPFFLVLAGAGPPPPRNATPEEREADFLREAGFLQKTGTVTDKTSRDNDDIFGRNVKSSARRDAPLGDHLAGGVAGGVAGPPPTPLEPPPEEREAFDQAWNNLEHYEGDLDDLVRSLCTIHKNNINAYALRRHIKWLKAGRDEGMKDLIEKAVSQPERDLLRRAIEAGREYNKALKLLQSGLGE